MVANHPPTTVTVGCKEMGGCWGPRAVAREAKGGSNNHGSAIARVAWRHGGQPQHQREGDGTSGRRDARGGLVAGRVVFGH